jgi:hypothetical protein
MNSVIEQNLRSLQQLKLEVSKEELKHLLETRRVLLVLTDDAPEHMVALRMAANLFSRLSMHVGLSGSDAGVAEALSEADWFGFIKVHRADGEPYHLTVSIGAKAGPGGLQAYASGWNLCLTSGASQDVSVRPSNALCGAALGAIVASESFNRMIGSVLGKKAFEERIYVSLLDYSSIESLMPAELPEVHIPNATLVGCGAIGNALVYTLAALPQITGHINLIDPDWFTKTNAHRYMLARFNEVETPRAYKTIRAKEFLSHHKGFLVQGFEKDFEAYLTEDSDDRRVPFLISAVDSPGKRREIGRQTPKQVLNASTGHFTLAVSTHYEAYSEAELPCLGCIYPPGEAEEARYALISTETGLTPSEVKAIDEVNGKMTRELLAAISNHRNKPIERYLEFEGQPFDSFYQHGICGGTQVQTASGQADIPLAPVSALAGVLLANELIKKFSPEFSRHMLENFLQLDLLNCSSHWFLQRRGARANCECQRAAYRKRFAQKYQ